MMSFELESFDLLQNRVNSLIQDGILKDRSLGLIHLFLSYQFRLESDEINECVVDGGNDCSIDAVFIDRRSEQPLVHLIQSKFYETSRKAQKNFKYSEANQINRFFEILKDPSYDLSKLVNRALEQKVLEIRDLQKRDFPEFKVWLISNGSPCVDHEIEPTKKSLNRLDVQLEQFHLHEFTEFCIKTHSTREQHSFNVREAGVLESGDTEIYSVVGYISARELYNVLKDLRDERKIDHSLFDLNVRSYLGLDSDINQEIVRSAVSSNNNHFSFLNNGITIIGNQVKVMKTSEPVRVAVKKMSIVNGTQTCSTIFQCMSEHFPNLESFEKLSVLFRLFQTDNPRIIEEISISSNKQNRIHARDLKANDKYQMAIESKLKQHKIGYLRKRGNFYSDTNDYPTLDAFRAGKLILSYVHQEPVRAKKNSDQIFTELYNKIFADVDILKLMRALDLYTKIEQLQSYISDEIRIRGIHRTDHTFITYGGFHILALCGRLEDSSKKYNDEELINCAVNIISNALHEASTPAFYNFFRDSVQEEKMLEMCLQPDLFTPSIT